MILRCMVEGLAYLPCSWRGARIQTAHERLRRWRSRAGGGVRGLGRDPAPLVGELERWPRRRSRSSGRTPTTTTSYTSTSSSPYSMPVVTGPLKVGVGAGCTQGQATPGHSDDMICFVVSDGSGRSFLGRHAVQGLGRRRRLRPRRSAVMDVYMAMPHERRLLPGHTDESTIGREWEENPFIRVWRGAQARGRRAGHCPRRACDADRLERPITTARARRGAIRRRHRRDRRRLCRLALTGSSGPA